MAKNTGENKRDAVKHVRDKAKAAYEKKDFCYICATKNDLELHHVHSMTIMLDSWARRKNYDISTDAGILAVREEFIAEHHKEIYELVFTLCNKHHVALHTVYGKTPKPGTETKQAYWIERQRDKHINGTPDPKVASTPLKSFAEFY